jgi:hypothetical protein
MGWIAQHQQTVPAGQPRRAHRGVQVRCSANGPCSVLLPLQLIGRLPADVLHIPCSSHNYWWVMGSHSDVRRGLDYSYHVNYSEERQKWQVCRYHC